MASRVSQVPLEVVIRPIPISRLTQFVLETIVTSKIPESRISQMVIEILSTSAAEVNQSRLSQILLEILYSVQEGEVEINPYGPIVQVI